jgi:hypothetical protein
MNMKWALELDMLKELKEEIMGQKMIKCWNCNMELDTSLISAAGEIETNPQPTDTYPHSFPSNVTIDLSLNEWEYVLNGLSALIESSYAWGWADTAVQTEINDIVKHIEGIIHA